MNTRRAGENVNVIVGIFLTLSFVSSMCGQTQPSVAKSEQREVVMTNHASGTFDVKLVPQGTDDKADTTLGRMSADKQFHGDLEATSKGEMLTAITSVKDSKGYVAIERVIGTLHGRRGTFVLQHSGIMTRGAQEQNVTVVPDSGTGQLTGITGKMTGKIVDGKHFYEFEYTLPETH